MSKDISSQQRNNHLKELLLLLSVPVGIIILIVALIYLPRLAANPAYGFIFCEGYSCDNRYSVSPSNRIIESNDADLRPYTEASLRYYDVERDATRPLSMDEAGTYRVDPTSKSPDGYTLQRNSGSGFLFFDDYRDSWSLEKGLVSKPVSLGDNGKTKQFIGWVLTDGE